MVDREARSDGTSGDGTNRSDATSGDGTHGMHGDGGTPEPRDQAGTHGPRGTAGHARWEMPVIGGPGERSASAPGGEGSARQDSPRGGHLDGTGGVAGDSGSREMRQIGPSGGAAGPRGGRRTEGWAALALLVGMLAFAGIGGTLFVAQSDGESEAPVVLQSVTFETGPGAPLSLDGGSANVSVVSDSEQRGAFTVDHTTGCTLDAGQAAGESSLRVDCGGADDEVILHVAPGTPVDVSGEGRIHVGEGLGAATVTTDAAPVTVSDAGSLPSLDITTSSGPVMVEGVAPGQSVHAVSEAGQVLLGPGIVGTGDTDARVSITTRSADVVVQPRSTDPEGGEGAENVSEGDGTQQ